MKTIRSGLKTMKQDIPHILLINPWIHDFAAYDFWAKPMGLLTLAALLIDHGLSVSYIDCLNRFHSRSNHTDPDARYGRGPYLKTRIAKPRGLEDVPRCFSRYGIKPQWFREDLQTLPPPDLILVTSLMTYWYPGVQETIAMVKSAFPDTPVVLGGIYASLCSEHAQKNSGADEVLTGPGEDCLLQLVHKYTGYSVKPKFNPEDLDSYPYPALRLQPVINYVPVLTSRGCPFHCAYCASSRLNPKGMRRSPESVIAEIKYRQRTCHVNDFVLYDDAFLVDPEKHALPILEKIVAETVGVRFHTPNAVHIRGITSQTASMMFQAGFTTLRLGLETAEFDQRRQMDSKVTEDEFQQAAGWLKKAGFDKHQVGAYLLVGLPGQTLRSIENSIRTVKCSGITPILAYYSPIPHTALWEKAVNASRYDLEKDPIFANNAIFPCQSEPFCWQTISNLKQLAAA
jgi:radical SAM superfamily enzyme YgiQ (UPF0313 family)